MYWRRRALWLLLRSNIYDFRIFVMLLIAVQLLLLLLLLLFMLFLLLLLLNVE